MFPIIMVGIELMFCVQNLTKDFDTLSAVDRND